MRRHPELLRALIRDPWGYLVRVARGFLSNQGFLLAGAVAYFTLLSIVPLSILLLVLLSQVMDQARLLATATGYLELVAPGQADYLISQVEAFIRHSNVIGVVGLVMLLLFSSMAFTALENAMSVIFFHRVAVKRRHFLVSAVIPYLYIFFLGLGLIVVSLISGALQALGEQTLEAFGRQWALRGISGPVLYVLGVVGEILLLTSIYMVMPVGRLALRHALIGGVAAGVLWEISRHVLVWYFSTLSMVNVVYGSLATAIVILITFEVAAVIVLLGAQLIAEYERGPHGGGPAGLVTGE
ncbi:MAG: YihY/virulence factor BrkB family protein [Gammaproteobacteria bacterium]|nr:YihY/virulence factor BrkB family protein [Gammaproteobacteria bacterium]